MGASTGEAQEKAGVAAGDSVRFSLMEEFVPDAVNGVVPSVAAAGPQAVMMKPPPRGCLLGGPGRRKAHRTM